jgi:hypothetical protein
MPKDPASGNVIQKAVLNIGGADIKIGVHKIYLDTEQVKVTNNKSIGEWLSRFCFYPLYFATT